MDDKCQPNIIMLQNKVCEFLDENGLCKFSEIGCRECIIKYATYLIYKQIK